VDEGFPKDFFYEGRYFFWFLPLLWAKCRRPERRKPKARAENFEHFSLESEKNLLLAGKLYLFFIPPCKVVFIQLYDFVFCALRAVDGAAFSWFYYASGHGCPPKYGKGE
jgi:hypothetical protein